MNCVSIQDDKTCLFLGLQIYDKHFVLVEQTCLFLVLQIWQTFCFSFYLKKPTFRKLTSVTNNVIFIYYYKRVTCHKYQNERTCLFRRVQICVRNLAFLLFSTWRNQHSENSRQWLIVIYNIITTVELSHVSRWADCRPFDLREYRSARQTLHLFHFLLEETNIRKTHDYD